MAPGQKEEGLLELGQIPLLLKGDCRPGKRQQASKRTDSTGVQVREQRRGSR